ncbi:MAG: hypothetical protein ABI995_03565 [Acidobacteriota bacterium]
MNDDFNKFESYLAAEYGRVLGCCCDIERSKGLCWFESGSFYAGRALIASSAGSQHLTGNPAYIKTLTFPDSLPVSILRAVDLWPGTLLLDNPQNAGRQPRGVRIGDQMPTPVDKVL